MNEIKELKIDSITDQGMKIESLSLKLLKNKHHNMIVNFSEEGFSEIWKTRIFLTKKQINFDHSHFWIKRFFNEDVTSGLCMIVEDYEDRLRKIRR